MYFKFWWNWKGYLQQTVIPLPYVMFATDLRMITICLYKRIYLISEILIILDNYQPFKLVWWCAKLKKLFVRLDCMHSDKYVILMEFGKLGEIFYEENRVYLWARTECRRSSQSLYFTFTLFFLCYIPNNIRLNFSLKPSFVTFIFVLIYYLCGCTVVE